MLRGSELETALERSNPTLVVGLGMRTLGGTLRRLLGPEQNGHATLLAIKPDLLGTGKLRIRLKFRTPGLVILRKSPTNHQCDSVCVREILGSRKFKSRPNPGS